MNVEFCDLLKNSLLSQIAPYLRRIVSIFIMTKQNVVEEVVLVPYLRGIVSIRARLKHSRINSLSSIFLAKNWTKRLLANTSRPKFCQKENNHLSP